MRQGLVVGLLLVGLWVPSSGRAAEPAQTTQQSTVIFIQEEILRGQQEREDNRLAEPETAPALCTFPHKPLVQIVADSHVLFQWRRGSEAILEDYREFETRKAERQFGFWNSRRFQSNWHFIIGDGSPPTASKSDLIFDTPAVFQYQPVVQVSPAHFSTFEWSPEAIAIHREKKVASQQVRNLSGYGSNYAIDRVSHFYYGSGPGRGDGVYSWGSSLENSFGLPVLQVSSDGLIRREGEFFFPTE